MFGVRSLRSKYSDRLPYEASKLLNDEWVVDRWLKDSGVKRTLWNACFSGLLSSTDMPSVYEIGGGRSGAQALLAKSCNYRNIDPLYMSHDVVRGDRTEDDAGNELGIAADWFDVLAGLASVDFVIANDLFPNVDQRLRLFLRQAKESAETVILSLTAAKPDSYYRVRRVDSPEVLTVKAMDIHALMSELEGIIPQQVFAQLPAAFAESDGLFNNERSVVLMSLSA